MKQLYIILTILTFTALSCKKGTIDLTPEDAYTSANFFKTEAQFRQAVVAAYVPLRDVMINDFYSAEMRSDNTHYQPIPSNRGTAYVNRENIDDFTNTPGNTYVVAMWEHCYRIISRTNVVIERLETFDMAAAAKNDIDGQAKFLRAWAYFKLVRQFGGVPLFLKEVKKAEDTFLLRSTEAEVYAQIIADAQDAVKELSNPVFPGTTNKQTGVATKGAATVLLADVFVTLKRWKEAEDLLVTLQPMGYALNANYAEAFLTSNKNSRESIFEVQFVEGTAVGTAPNTIPFMFLPRNITTAVVTGNATDTRSTGGWNTPTPDLISAYEPGDKRLDASIAIAEGAYDGSDYFVYSANKSIVGYTNPPAGKIAVPYVKKFIHTPYVAVNNANDNWPVYRYSEALLLLAEALNEQGKSPAAPLKEVRDRAFGVGVSPITTADPTALKDIIMHERRVELAFENKRWHDLVRSGKAVQVMNAHGTVLKQQFNWHTASSYSVTANKLLYPLPASEIEYNPGLIQNPL